MSIVLTESQKNILSTHDSARFTRRDLLGVSAKFCAGAVVANPFRSQMAFGFSNDSVPPAFLTLDLIGGAAISGNFLVGGKGGSHDYLNSYSMLGFNPSASQLDDRFGLPAPKNVSRMFEGLIAKASLEAQKNIRIAGIAHPALDDVDANRTNALGVVSSYQASLNKFKRKGFGSLATNSGGRTQLSLDQARFRPEQLSNVDQLRILAGFYSLSDAGIGLNSQKSVVARLANKFREHFSLASSPDELSARESFDGVMRDYLDAVTPMEVDPRKLAVTQKIFGLSQGTASDNQNAIIAGMAVALLNGYVGPSCIALGGYDYHDSTQTTGDARDQFAGEVIGSVIELAYQLKRPVFIQVITDGSVVAREGTRIWTGDSGVRSMSLMVCYDPAGPVTHLKTQLGHFTNGQVAATDTFVAKSTVNVANTVFLNYLATFGREADFFNLISEGVFPRDQVEFNTAFAQS